MRLGERILLFFLRPIYRAVFKGPIERAKASLLADITARVQSVERLSIQLRDAEANLAAMLHHLRAEVIPYLQRLEARHAELRNSPATGQIAAHLRSLEASNMAQWNAIEQLVISLLSLPHESLADQPAEAAIANGVDLNGVHAASSLR